ncbi:hypothetical protein CAPTEDRAFT_210428 [Capitella teleta]|uniref:Uncharacterized protein n=1 Tax=Capitella teleta TaxID=283909 RepID=R7TSH9_CAPTE|nr:hypothetical protein CAPTEDRAFT_210428 [Capitella teleta]|eukprot:ELT96614.1 hypothetical protein CAPTEDRAFT_210428 [Capitella teleta]
MSKFKSVYSTPKRVLLRMKYHMRAYNIVKCYSGEMPLCLTRSPLRHVRICTFIRRRKRKKERKTNKRTNEQTNKKQTHLSLEESTSDFRQTHLKQKTPRLGDAQDGGRIALTTSLSSATAEASAASPSLTERFHWSCTKLDSGTPSMHSEDASQLRYAARSFKLHAAMDELVRESLAHIDTRVFALKEHLYQKLAKRDKSCTGYYYYDSRLSQRENRLQQKILLESLLLSSNFCNWKSEKTAEMGK